MRGLPATINSLASLGGEAIVAVGEGDGEGVLDGDWLG